jgi:hypothetical protein
LPAHLGLPYAWGMALARKHVFRTVRAWMRLACRTIAAGLLLSACAESSAKEGSREPCPKGKYEAVYFAVDPSGKVVKFPMDDLERYQRSGYRPASQEQAKAYVRRECPAGFR